MDQTLPALAELAAQRRGELTVACLEQLTVGLLAQALATAGGSSEWFRGGVVFPDLAACRRVLDLRVDAAVEEATAALAARAVAARFGADVGVAALGVPCGSTAERPPGTVVIGWSVGRSTHAETLQFPGDDTLRDKATRAVLARLAGALSER